MTIHFPPASGVHVAGLWELGWSAPINEIDLWSHMLTDFEVNSFTMSPISGISSRHVREVSELPMALDAARAAGLVVVFLDEKGTETLDNFVHPTNVLYVFGKNAKSPMGAYAQPGDFSVRIEPSRGGLWPHQAAAIALYDRSQKAT